MPLIHRTNYQGGVILASKAKGHDRDKDIGGLEVIWTQFSTSRRYATCCFGFGTRRVDVRRDHLLSQHDGEWNLYLASEHEGKSAEHYFYKFVLIPRGTRNFGKKTCTHDQGWQWIGAVVASDANVLRDLADLLQPYYNGDKMTHNSEDIEKHHVHVGIKMEKLVTGRSY